MDNKTIEVQNMLLEIADRLGTLQLKLKDTTGEEYNRLMKIAEEVRKGLEEMVDIEDKETYENKVSDIHDKSDNL